MGTNASDSDGTVEKTEFYAGATKLSQTTTAPYLFVLPQPGAGTYTLTAQATDNAGLRTKSGPVKVVVSQP